MNTKTTRSVNVIVPSGPEKLINKFIELVINLERVVIYSAGILCSLGIFRKIGSLEMNGPQEFNYFTKRRYFFVVFITSEYSSTSGKNIRI